jgi:hypothetical protein
MAAAMRGLWVAGVTSIDPETRAGVNIGERSAQLLTPNPLMTCWANMGDS